MLPLVGQIGFLRSRAAWSFSSVSQATSVPESAKHRIPTVRRCRGSTAA